MSPSTPLLARAARRGALPAAALAAAALVAPAGAEAASVIHDATRNAYVYIDDTPRGEDNDVKVRVVGGKLVISDVVAQRSGTNRCVVAGASLECASGTPTLDLRLGAGGDRLDHRGPQGGTVDMGPGGDIVFAGQRDPRLPRGLIRVDGGESLDWINFGSAPSPVSVTADDNLVDGTAGENLLVFGMEAYFGSRFADRLWGSARADTFLGEAGDDSIAGGAGGDIFIATHDDGADDYHGGPDVDGITYGPRGGTVGVNVSLDDVANDGAPFERDQVRSNVENVSGTAGDDKLFSMNAFSVLDGGDGDDRLDGGDGPDTLVGGRGRDTLLGGPGSDSLTAADDEQDTIDCGTQSDSVTRDRLETKVAGCEADVVGILRLDRRAVVAQAGETTEVGIGWRHPRRWKLLRAVTVHLADGPARVGSVRIDLHGGRAQASGAVRLAGANLRLEREGRAVHAVLPLRLDPSLQGRTLTIAVEAVERGGRRQAVERAGTVRVR